MKKNGVLYNAIIKSMLGRYAVYATNLISLVILARIFTPEIYGTVTAVMVFFVFFQLMAEAGLGPAIINIHELDEIDRDGLFGLTLAIGGFLAFLFVMLAPLLQTLYQLQRIDEVVPYVAIGLFFFAAAIVPTALLLREQAFFKIARAGLAAEILSTLASIILVRYIDPLHALASKGIFSAFTTFLVVWYFSANTKIGRPKPGRKFSAIKPLLSFSSYQLGFNFINYFSRNLDNILVGKYMGAVALGLYDKAYQLMRYPLMLLTFAMTPAIQPVIRQHAGDYKKVEEIHRDFTFKISLLGALAGLLMYISADLIVSILLGSQWGDVVPIIRILALSIPVQVVLSTSGSFFQAMNRTDLLFHCGIFSSIVTVSFIVIGVLQKNIESICWGLVFAFHVNFIQAYYYLYKKVFFVPLSTHLIRMLPAASVVAFMVLSSVFFPI